MNKGIGICFYYTSQDEDEYSGNSSLFNFWRLCGKVYGIKRFAVISDEPIDWNDSSVSLSHYYTYEQFALEHPNHARLSGKGNTDLDVSKEIGWYCFGPPEGWPEDSNDIKLDFPHDTNLHAVQVLPVFLDRVYKKWQ